MLALIDALGMVHLYQIALYRHWWPVVLDALHRFHTGWWLRPVWVLALSLYLFGPFVAQALAATKTVSRAATPTTAFIVVAQQVTNPLPSGPGAQSSDYNITITNPHAIDADDPILGLALLHGGTVTGLGMSYVGVSGCSTVGWVGKQPEFFGVVAEGHVFPALAQCTIHLRITSDGTVPPGNYPLTAISSGSFNGVDVDTLPVLADIVVADRTPPTITGMPADIVVAAAGPTGTHVNWTAPTAGDNDRATLTASHHSGDLFPIGVTNIVYTATDPAGNSTQGQFSITVIDGAAPVIFAPADITVNAAPGANSAIVNFAISATDLKDGDLSGAIVLSHASGSRFPVGQTMVTADVTDSDGHAAAQVSFNITVRDGEKPVIAPIATKRVTTAPSDRTASVSFSTSVSDNVDPAHFFTPVFKLGTTVITSPHDFPIGNSTVTVTANSDTSGNAADPVVFDVVVTDGAGAGPAVMIGGVPQGFVGRKRFDLAVTFTDEVTGFDASDVMVTGGNATALLGRGKAYVVHIVPDGVADRVAVSVPAQVAVTSGGLFNKASNRVFVTNLTEGETQKIISEFIMRKQELILSSKPDLHRRIDRLNRRPHARTGVNADLFGLQAYFPSPIDVAINRQGVRYAASSAPFAVMDEDNGDTDRWDWSVWSEGKIALFENRDGGRGLFGIGHIGVERLIHEDVLIGGAVQLDWMHQNATSQSGAKSSTGWMAGPYALVKIDENFYIDVRGAIGQSQNKLQPFGTYDDRFIEDRILFSAALVGQFSVEHWTITPTLSVDYMRSFQRAYLNGLGQAIGGQQFTAGKVSFAPRISYEMQLENGGDVTPWVEFVAATDLANGVNSLHAGVASGVSYQAESGGEASIAIRYNGIGHKGIMGKATDFSVKLSLSAPLN